MISTILSNMSQFFLGASAGIAISWLLSGVISSDKLRRKISVAVYLALLGCGIALLFLSIIEC